MENTLSRNTIELSNGHVLEAYVLTKGLLLCATITMLLMILLFLLCDAMRCTVFAIVILSVCLSHLWTVSTWFDLRS